jgi:hypothetical protein
MAGAIQNSVRLVILICALSPTLAVVYTPDPLLQDLAGDDYEDARPLILRDLRGLERPACETLAAYRDQRNDRVRENAVRALRDAGCRSFTDYSPYLDDPSPWVTETILLAVEKYLMVEAAPFLIDHLTDRRRIVSGDGSWTIGETAHRVLQTVTCQSFHYDPLGRPGGWQESQAEWRRWYAAHRTESREAWIDQGIARARDYLARDYAPHRVEGLRLLALIGGRAFPALREALARAPTDLIARVVCQPEEPPRVTDEVPCLFQVMNASRRHVALAPLAAAPELRVKRQEEGPDRGSSTRPVGGEKSAAPSLGKGRAGKPSHEKPGAVAGDVAAPAAARQLPAAEFSGWILDLAPGETWQREFKVGPVLSAGRYEVRATFSDFISSLEASAIVRFEQ